MCRFHLKNGTQGVFIMVFKFGWRTLHLQPAVGRYAFQSQTPSHNTELAIQLRSEEPRPHWHRDLAEIPS